MIKVHTFKTAGTDTDFIVCNFCGNGIGLVSPQESIDDFVTEHTNCDNLENTDLALLNADAEYIS